MTVSIVRTIQAATWHKINKKYEHTESSLRLWTNRYYTHMAIMQTRERDHAAVPKVACTMKELHWVIIFRREANASSIASLDAVSKNDINSINSTP
jgi:hypothetical protein